MNDKNRTSRAERFSSCRWSLKTNCPEPPLPGRARRQRPGCTGPSDGWDSPIPDTASVRLSWAQPLVTRNSGARLLGLVEWKMSMPWYVCLHSTVLRSVRHASDSGVTGPEPLHLPGNEFVLLVTALPEPQLHNQASCPISGLRGDGLCAAPCGGSHMWKLRPPRSSSSQPNQGQREAQAQGPGSPAVRLWCGVCSSGWSSSGSFGRLKLVHGESQDGTASAGDVT